MGLLEILKEQAAFGFTGRINILLRSTGQVVGVVFQKEGYIVSAKMNELTGMNSLHRMVYSDVEQNDFKIIVEPEFIDSELETMKITFEELRDSVQKGFRVYQDSKKLKPPMNLNLIINPEIIVDKTVLTPDEYDVLLLITEWSKVSEIYSKSNLMEYQITNALVSLRKKKALKVFQN